MNEFEASEERHNELRQERLNVQKKTFTKWANIHLQKHSLEVEDLFYDLGDGKRLMKLLEAITGEKIGRPAQGFSRINKIENVSRCLAFLHSKKMRLENISSEDIVDGNPNLILGLLWTIILRCEIWNLQQNALPESTPPFTQSMVQPAGQKIAKDSLLLWCQTKTDGYPGVKVKNFGSSWRNGLAFNALIHSHLPNLVDFNRLEANQPVKNLDNAFDLALKYIGVPKLLDPEDVDTNNPDEKSILIYVSTFCKGLANVKKGMTGGKRIANILAKMMEIDKLKEEYENSAVDLLEWISAVVADFHSYPNSCSLDTIHEEIVRFKDFRTEEKPQWYELRNDSEAILFSIQMELKTLGQVEWLPPDGKSVADIEKAWSGLESAEHEHELSLRELLRKQENLENLAEKFESKLSVRDGYLKEMQKVLTDSNYGTNIKQVDATFKKHEAVRTGVLSREDMFQDLFKIADFLIEANYRRKDEIAKERDVLKQNWNYVKRLLEAYDDTFDNLRRVVIILEEMDVILEEMQQMEMQLRSDGEPLDVESCLQQHALTEVQLSSWGTAVNTLCAKVDAQDRLKSAPVLQTQLQRLQRGHKSLLEASTERRKMLEALLQRRLTLERVAEIEAWIGEMKLYCRAKLTCRDLPSALHQFKKHKFLATELALQRDLADAIPDDDNCLNENSQVIQRIWEEKLALLAFAVQVYQYQTDADECESWISEKLQLMKSMDCGKDVLTCQALFRRHDHMELDINAYDSEIQSLRIGAQDICLLGLSQIYVLNERYELTDQKELPEDKMKDRLQEKNESNSTTALPVSDQIAKRQKAIDLYYEYLKNMCEVRKERLQNAEDFFRFLDACEETEAWLKNKEGLIEQKVVGEENEEVEKYIEVFIADMLTRSTVVKELETIVQNLEANNFEKTEIAKTRISGIQQRWQRLNEWKNLKEKSLKGFTSLLLSYRMCEETRLWMNEKLKALQDLTFSGQIRNLHNLRRKHEQLQRELIPVEEKLKKAISLTKTVAVTYPEERENLHIRIRELEQLWDRVQELADEKRMHINESAGYGIFKASSEALIEWSKEMMLKMAVREKMNEVSIAESVANDHKDDGNEVATRDDQFSELIEMGKDLGSQNSEIQATIHRLEEARKCVQDMWQDKEDWIRQCLDQQIFTREANVLDSLSTSYDTLLEKTEHGKTLGDVEILLKRNETLIETLKAQDSRFVAFDNMANQLIAAGHIESEYIDSRREEVLSHRLRIKEKSQKFKSLLRDAFEFELFKANAHEIDVWINEKEKLALDIFTHDIMTDLRRKMKRHQTFQAELIANEERLEIVNTSGQALILQSHYSENAVICILEQLNESWKNLCEMSNNNDKQLKEACQLQNFEKAAEILNHKLNELNKSLGKETGHNLRSVKGRLKEHEILEKEYQVINSKVFELIHDGERIISGGHFAGDMVREKIDEIKSKLMSIETPMTTRRLILESNLRSYQFLFEVDCEMLWIKENQGLLSTVTQTRNLLDAQKQQKKLENLEIAVENHRTSIENVLDEGKGMTFENECTDKVLDACRQLQIEWKQLLDYFEIKKSEASLSLKVQMFYSEISEIESWIDEKCFVLNNDDYGKDENAVIKLLTNLKALELDIDSYIGLVGEIENQAELLFETKCTESVNIKSTMETINQEMKNIQDLCSVRRQKLLQSKNRHEFQKETEEIEVWIKEQMAEALSEDYGQDYEHILELHGKFEFFRAKLEAGSIRILQYEEFARKLLSSDCHFADEVQIGLENLSQFWSDLVETADARAFKMEAAVEIHRYHRDVTDVLSRIHDHYQGMNTDLGNNYTHVQSLVKKHDLFEHELLALEAQVHQLLKDSQRLQETYPGGNEEHIQMQLSLVIENWNLFEQKVTIHKSQLLVSQRGHKFISKVRDVESWAETVRLELEVEERIRDIAAVEQLEAQQELLGTEIETRNSHLKAITEEGQELLIIPECAHLHPQIKEKLKKLSESMEKLGYAWKKKSKHISLYREICSFFEEAKQMEIQCSKKEVQLCGCEMRESVEDINSALKKHLEIQRSMKVQDQKFEAWKNEGEHLIKQHVAESEMIQKKIEELSLRRKKLWDFSKENSERLANALLYAKFRRDILEAESWITEKKNKLRTLLNNKDKLSIEEKVRYLQKQQALQAELKAHELRIANIQEQGEEVFCRIAIDTSDPDDAMQVRHRLQFLLDNWDEVKGNAARIGADLQEARHIVEFRKLFHEVDTWLKEKELLINANDLGRDYEHCVELQRRLDDMDSDMNMDDKSMEQLEDLSKLLFDKGYENNLESYENIKIRWNTLKERNNLYRTKLYGACDVHLFLKQANDVSDRIREKRLAVVQKEDINDLSEISNLSRKHDLLKQELTVIKTDIDNLDSVSGNLLRSNSGFSTEVIDKMSEVRKEWVELEEQLQNWKQSLDECHDNKSFTNDVNDIEKLVTKLITEMIYGEVPQDVASLQNMLQTHDAIKDDILTHKNNMQILHKRGNNLKWSDKIEECLNSLEKMKEDLDFYWEERHTLLLENIELRVFIDKAKQVECWQKTKEAYFANTDLGDSLTSVKSLQMKHLTFEQSCQAFQGKYPELEKMCKDIVEKNHVDSTNVQARYNEISQRRDEIITSSELRKKLLDDSWAYQQFLTESYEVENWISEKIRLAKDAKIDDLTNIPSKIQKQAAFEAEILNNSSRVNILLSKASEFSRQNHFASQDILAQVQNSESMWSQLIDISDGYKKRLANAMEAFKFKLKLDDFDSWIEETEASLLSEECGQDFVSLKQQIAKHGELENDFNEESDVKNEIEKSCLKFQEDNHFLKDDMMIAWTTTTAKFDALRNKMTKQREDLHDALSLAEFEDEISDQVSWITQKVDMCSSDEIFTDILSVQVLLKQLQVLETELVSREVIILSLLDKADQMQAHPKYFVVEKSRILLQKSYGDLKNAIHERKLRFDEAHEAQSYYLEATHAVIWIKEKMSRINAEDGGKDINSVESFLKEVHAIKVDVENFTRNIEELQDLSSGLLDRDHFDKQNIQEKQDNVNKCFGELQEKVETQISFLKEKKRLLIFEKDIKNMITKLQSMSGPVYSEEYGQDVEHVESLAKKFDIHFGKIRSLSSSITMMKQTAQMMIDERSEESENIEELLENLNTTWSNINKSAEDRTKALHGARLVHIFNRSLDETDSWINDKTAALSSNNYGHDLESIKILLKQHEIIEGDLKGINDRIQKIMEQITSLSQYFVYNAVQIEEKYESIMNNWNNCLDLAEDRKKKLHEADQFQLYIEEAKDLQAEIQEMIALVTNAELPSDIPAAQTLIDVHGEYGIEIKALTTSFDSFESRGKDIILNGNFMAEDIENKMHALRSQLETLKECWESRKTIYVQHLDLLIFKGKLKEMDDWLQNQQDSLMYEDCNSVEHIERLIAHQDYFEKQIQFQDHKFKELERATMLEEHSLQMKKIEELEMIEEKKRLEQLKVEELKRQEEEKIIEDRRKDSDRAKAIYGNEAEYDYFTTPGEPIFKRINSTRLSSHRLGSKSSIAAVTNTPSQSNLKKYSFTKKLSATPDFSKKYSYSNQLPPTTAEGFLERKQELLAGGKRSTSRQWKTYYTVLCGHLLCFFKDQNSFILQNTAVSPVNILGAICSHPADYRKKKHVFRLILADKTTYLFCALDPIKKDEWVQKISFVANLRPENQLSNFERGSDSEAEHYSVERRESFAERGSVTERGSVIDHDLGAEHDLVAEHGLVAKHGSDAESGSVSHRGLFVKHGSNVESGSVSHHGFVAGSDSVTGTVSFAESMPNIYSERNEQKSSSIGKSEVGESEGVTQSLPGTSQFKHPHLSRLQSDDSTASSGSRFSFTTAISSTTLRDPNDSSEDGDWYSVIDESTPRGSIQWSASDSDFSYPQKQLSNEFYRSSLEKIPTKEDEAEAPKKEKKWRSMFTLRKHSGSRSDKK